MSKILQKQAEIGNRIAFLLKEKEMSQKDLADKAKIGEPSVSAILKGERNLTLKMIVRLESALNGKIIMIPKD